MSKVLIVGTSHKTRGGITSVINAHKSGYQWKKNKCFWIETHRDSNVILKFFYFIKSLFTFLLLCPFYDLIHIHMAIKGSLNRKIIFMSIALCCGKKTIVHFHPPDPDDLYKPEYKRRFSFMFRNADKVIVLSKSWKDLLEKTFNLKNVDYLYNPCPKIKEGVIDQSQKYILFAGTIIYRKGYECLIRAFGLISKEHPDWKLFMAGNGEIEKAKSIAEEYNISDKINFLGWISGEEKETVFRNASIFCLPSYGEGFPMAVLDAWAYGLPVVCTPVGGLPDIIQDKYNGFFFEFNNENQLASILSELMSNSELRHKVSTRSRELADTTFNQDNICRQLDNIYESLLNK